MNITNHERNVLAEDIAKTIDKALGRTVVRDGDMEPIYCIVDHYLAAMRASFQPIDMPSLIECWTADEVAECLSYQKYMSEGEGIDLSHKLWQFVDEAEKPTPLGGDGTNGTVETPEERLDPSNDDKTPHWWDRLSREEKDAIARAVKDEYSEYSDEV